jgi:hypothetical protein
MHYLNIGSAFEIYQRPSNSDLIPNQDEVRIAPLHRQKGSLNDRFRSMVSAHGVNRDFHRKVLSA